MTSKEIQEMIDEIEDQIERFGVMNSMKVQLSVLKSYKQDLERLEMLEKEKTELLLAHSRVLKSSSETNRLTLEILKENEKLKTAIEILKDFVNIDNFSINANGFTELSKLDYELLKEVLVNDK